MKVKTTAALHNVENTPRFRTRGFRPGTTFTSYQLESESIIFRQRPGKWGLWVESPPSLLVEGRGNLDALVFLYQFLSRSKAATMFNFTAISIWIPVLIVIVTGA